MLFGKSPVHLVGLLSYQHLIAHDISNVFSDVQYSMRNHKRQCYAENTLTGYT